jgi:hypothetical protein
MAWCLFWTSWLCRKLISPIPLPSAKQNQPYFPAKFFLQALDFDRLEIEIYSFGLGRKLPKQVGTTTGPELLFLWE